MRDGWSEDVNPGPSASESLCDGPESLVEGQCMQKESTATETRASSGEALGFKGPVPGRVLGRGGPFDSI